MKPNAPSALRSLPMTRGERHALAVVFLALFALLLGCAAFAQSTPPPPGVAAEPRIHLRATAPELHAPGLRDDSHEARLRDLAAPPDDPELQHVDSLGWALLKATLGGLGLCALVFGVLTMAHPAGRAGWSALLLALATLSLTGCAGLQVRAAVPVGGDGKAVLGVDGKAVTVELRGTLPVSR